MRSPLFTTALLAALVSTVSSRATHRLSKRSTDTCASLINKPLAVTVTVGLPPVSIGIISTCLCVSGIPNFLQSNVVGQAAVAVAGAPAATAALQSLITASGSVCSYPDNAAPICTTSNPCSFTCSNGFTATNLDCVCPAPSRVCNGVCGDFGTACPSAVLTPEKRDGLQKRGAVCSKGLTACGVYGWSQSKSWDCVDTQNDIESCGGCAVPLTLSSPVGVDCTTIPGVADVSCVTGSCAVHRCLPGYARSTDGSFCIRKATIKGDPTAFDYGLEHVPLKRRVWKGARDEQ
ncbi:hypothetical protein K474DRAFT_66776 [Panus rudis PR-1116 ss-1]|nr:hypothetical protein K474DRAFT_66776 [Panus rudis PR-1116 ss-1]